MEILTREEIFEIDDEKIKRTTYYYVDENGNEVIRGVIECTYVEESEEPIAPEPTQLDRIEETVNSIASGTTAENTEAINALLGV